MITDVWKPVFPSKVGFWTAVGVAILASWGFVHQRDGRIRAEVQLAAAVARADSTARAAHAAVVATRARDTVTASVERREEAHRAVAGAAADSLAARAPAAATAVVSAAAPADSAAVRARLDSLVALYDARDRARLEQLRADSAIIDELHARDVTRLAAIASLETALAASQAEAKAALAARPGWIERTLPKIAVGVALVGGWWLRGLLHG